MSPRTEQNRRNKRAHTYTKTAPAGFFVMCAVAERCSASKPNREPGSRKFASDGERIMGDQHLFKQTKTPKGAFLSHCFYRLFSYYERYMNILSSISLLICFGLLFRYFYISKKFRITNPDNTEIRDLYKKKFGVDFRFSILSPINAYRANVLLWTDQSAVMKELRRKILLNTALFFIFGILTVILQSNNL